MLHVPYKYAFTFTSTMHFIPVFMNDMAGIMEAQTARGVEFDARRHREEGAPHGAPVRAASGVARCARRTAPPSPPRCAASTCARAASGYKDYPLHAEDFVALAVCVAVLAAAIVLAVMG